MFEAKDEIINELKGKITLTWVIAEKILLFTEMEYWGR